MLNRPRRGGKPIVDNQERLFDTEVHALYHKIVLDWRARFRSCLDPIRERYEPREDVDLDALADMVSTAIEGGMVLGRATGNSAILPEQILMVRTYVKLLFRRPSPASAPAPALCPPQAPPGSSADAGESH